ncbi:MAG: transporter substrate-binding domain-containing protein [Bacteroidetes bacterium]|nr:MAG: transporter substrate-binding domain-containing protein [Bacteroidota bacterium]
MTFHYSLKILAFLVLTLGITQIPVCNTTKDTSAGSDSLNAVDIPHILARKKIVALTDNSSTSYFIYKGEPMGYEYEMLRSFAKHLKVDLQIIVAKDMNEIFDLLQKGEVDIVCANLTVTEERMKKVNFTEPLIYTRQVLVQPKPKGWQNMNAEKQSEYLVRTTIDMSEKNIYVRKGSSFYSRLVNLQDEIASKINIIEVPGEVTTEGLIAMVANGKIPFTISDENVAMVNQTYYPALDIKTAISFPQKIAWAVNKRSPLLLAELNSWIIHKKNTTEYAALYNKYFKNPKGAGQRNESEFSSLGGNKISPYDDMIMAYSREIGWDWRLLASMIYQESKFDPNAQSWAGACGLMQMIPSTALQYGLDTCGGTAIESIDAGTRHIIKLDQYWAKVITNKNERIKFVLASYNVGLGHIIDARNLSRKYGKNPDLWQGNVEKYILLKSFPKYYNDPAVRCGYCRGQEPYNYVREIISRYEHYKNTIKENDENHVLADKTS